jgi:hypothetical protein
MIRIRRVALVLAVIAVTLLGIAGALPAHASSVLFPPPHGGPGTPPAGPVAPVVRVMVAGGMPGWQVALITIAASLVSATAAVLVCRARTTRSPMPLGDARRAQAVPPR